jgi:hypothetical protein
MAAPSVISLEGLSPLVNPAWSRGPVDDDTVEQALNLIDRSSIVGRLGAWRKEDNGGRHPGGRNTNIPDRSILALFVLAAIDNTPLLVSAIENMINHRLSDRALELLNIDRQHDTHYASVWRAIHRVIEPINGYQVAHNRRYTESEAADVRLNHDYELAAKYDERANWVMNQLLEVTWKLMPRDIRRKYKGNLAIDATALAVISPNRRGTGNRMSDPFAHWRHRSGGKTVPNPEGNGTIKTADRYEFGYDLHLGIIGTNDPSKVAEFPSLVIGITIAFPGSEVGQSALRILQSLNVRRHPKGHLIADRGYLPNALEENLQIPARELGWKLVFDYKTTELGLQKHHAGAILVEGSWYCPSMPEVLINASKDYQDGRIGYDVYYARIDERRNYQLHYKTQADKHGNVRLQCPAVGPSATAVCPLRPQSSAGTRVHLRIPVKKPANPGRICKQQTVTFFNQSTDDKLVKYRQDIPYHTPEWSEMYGTLRNAIEGFNGYVKDNAYESLEATGRRRLRGRIAQYLLSTFLIMAANIRRIRAFLAERSDPDKITRLTATHARRQQERQARIDAGRAPPGYDEEPIAI